MPLLIIFKHLKGCKVKLVLNRMCFIIIIIIIII